MYTQKHCCTSADFINTQNDKIQTLHGFWLFYLQVLISIQSLILCAEPYYNEPGFERLYGTPQGDSESLKYSEEVFRNNLKYAVVGQLTNPPEGFEDVVRAHFYLKRDFLLEVNTRASESMYITISLGNLKKSKTNNWPTYFALMIQTKLGNHFSFKS